MRKVTIEFLVLAMSMFVISSCDLGLGNTGGKYVDDLSDFDKKDKKSMSLNVNGFNLSYYIEDIYLVVGDTLKVMIDSKNEVKTWGKLTINDEDVLYTSDLPSEYSRIVDAPGTYTLVFSAYDGNEQFKFDSEEVVSIDDK